MKPFDLENIFALDVPFFELVLRGSVMYLALFVAFRVIGRRETGSVGISDLLVTVLIADAAQNGMAGGYKSVSGGIILSLTVMLWALAIDYIAFKFPAFRSFAQCPPLLLIKDGKIQRRNCASEHIDHDELMRQAREAGLERLDDVRVMYLEADGGFTVIKREKQ